MKKELIPRRCRKHVLSTIKEFEHGVGSNDNFYRNWEEFLAFKYIGAQDEWMKTNNKKYQSLRWLRGITFSLRAKEMI